MKSKLVSIDDDRNCIRETLFFLEPRVFDREQVSFPPAFSFFAHNRSAKEISGKKRRTTDTCAALSVSFYFAREAIPVADERTTFFARDSVASRPFVDIISSGNRNKRER